MEQKSTVAPLCVRALSVGPVVAVAGATAACRSGVSSDVPKVTRNDAEFPDGKTHPFPL
jgi:hypothetical protein